MIRCKYMYVVPITLFIVLSFDFISHSKDWLRQSSNGLLTFVLFFLIPSLLNIFLMSGLLKRDRYISLVLFFCVLVFSVIYSLGGDDELLIILCALNAIFTGLLGWFLKRNYNVDDINALKKNNVHEWVIKLATRNMLKNEIEKRIKGKVLPQALSRVAGGIASDVLTQSLSSGHTTLLSDDLMSTAMSIADNHFTAFETGGSNTTLLSDDLMSTVMGIADHHISAFETGGSSVSGATGPDFNPATGLPMISDALDAGGDVYGSSLNHDHIFDSHNAFDNSFSGSFDSYSSFDSGSSFSSGFDDNHY